MPSSSPARLGWLLLALATSLSATSLGAEKDDLSRARSKFMQATELEQAGNYSAAIQAFREVAQVRMTPQVRFHIATCEEKLGKLVTALGGYELALAEGEPLGPEFLQEVQVRAEALRGRIPKLVIERGEGAQAATIELDGVSLGSTSIGVEVSVDPGPHAVSAKAPGYESFSATIEVPEKRVERVVVTLEKAATGEAKTSDPAGASPVLVAEEPKRSRLVPYVIGGVGAAAVLNGIAFYLLQWQTDKELYKLCGNDTDCTDADGPTTKEGINRADTLHSRLNAYSIIAPVSLVAGIVATGTAATLILTEPKKAKPATAWFFSPSAPGADVGGLSVGKRF